VLGDKIRERGLSGPGEGYGALRRFGGPRPLRRWRKHRALGPLLRAAGGGVAGIVADSWKSAELVPAERAGAPLLVLAHGMEVPPGASLRRAWRLRQVFARVDAIAANSAYTADLVRPYLPRSGRAPRLAVVPPPIPPQPGADPATVAALKAEGGPVLLSLARLEPRKGVDMVLRALPGLAAHFPGLRFLVAGDGPDRGRLERLAGSLGVGGRVRFLGRVDTTTKAALYAAADLLAMPARREGASVEGFGITYLEAAWYGLPALAGWDGGAADAVADGETGLLCDGADLASVEAALSTLLGDPARLRAMGGEAAARVRAGFLWDSVLPRYLALLRGEQGAAAS
jgi:phosphatidyl-myo-inositol dimannoside synthase